MIDTLIPIGIVVFVLAVLYINLRQFVDLMSVIDVELERLATEGKPTEQHDECKVFNLNEWLKKK